MDGVHDLGGAEGHGPVVAEANEPVFHAEWERRAFGITFASFAHGLSNGGQFRHAIERMDAVHYLTSRYYEHWLTSVATRLVETGYATRDELAGFPLSRPVSSTGISAPPPATAAFAVGQPVRVRDVQTRGHTRCPAYVRGRRGVVVRADPPASVPDVEAHDSDAMRTEPTYCVRFDSRELWGAACDDGPACVHVDLWASYLEAV